MPHSTATADRVPSFGHAERQDAAGDAFNGLNEPLWQAIEHRLGHAPTYAECLDAVQAMPNAELAVFL